jgi:hypothetical protein
VKYLTIVNSNLMKSVEFHDVHEDDEPKFDSSFIVDIAITKFTMFTKFVSIFTLISFHVITKQI